MLQNDIIKNFYLFMRMIWCETGVCVVCVRVEADGIIIIYLFIY